MTDRYYSAFDAFLKIFVRLALAGLVIWMLNGGQNDWEAIHKLALSMILTSLLAMILLMIGLIVCCIVDLFRWIMDY